MERRVFTLNHYYMDTVNKSKEKEMNKNDNRQQPTTTKSIWIPKNNSTETVTYATVSNEVQAAKDIQIALHAYSKVNFTIRFLNDQSLFFLLGSRRTSD